MYMSEDLLLDRLAQIRQRRDKNPHRAPACDAQERLLVNLIRDYSNRYHEGLEAQIVYLFVRTPLGRQKLRQFQDLCRENGSPERTARGNLHAFAAHLRGQSDIRQQLDQALRDARTPGNGDPGIKSEYVWMQVRAQGQLLLDLASYADRG